jgi:hypothetical protein
VLAWGRYLPSLLATARAKLGPRLAWLPGADDLGDGRHQEQLADDHLKDSEALARVAGRHQVAVAGRGQGSEGEKQVLGDGSLTWDPKNSPG